MLYTFPPFKKVIFKERLNRFVARAQDEHGETLLLHVPNSGRMKELLLPDTPVWYAPRTGEGKTAGTLWLAQAGESLVAVHSLLANWAAGAALWERQIPELADYELVKPEFKKGNSRFDFLLKHKITEIPLLLEVKSVNLVKDGVGLFPDAPTLRGVKHLEELTALVQEGEPAAVLFMHLRTDAKEFAPYTEIHPEFTLALQKARQAGVKCLAYGIHLTIKGVTGVYPVSVNF